MSKTITIIAPPNHNLFLAGSEIFPFEEKHPEKRERMSVEEFGALSACRTPAFSAVGQKKDGSGEIICPLRFLSEFEITRSVDPKEILKATDKEGRLTWFMDSTGKIQPIEYPKGKTYAVCDAVVLIAQSTTQYAIVYGLQTKKGLSEKEAAAEFGECILHQAHCNKD